MGKKKADGGEPKGGKGKMVPALVLAVGLIGGGYFMGGKGSAAPAPAEAGHAAPGGHGPTTTIAEPGEIVTLDSITLNLADERFLKVGLALQLAKGANAEHIEHEGAKALDEAITLFGGHSFAQLADPAGRAAAKQELAKRVGEAYHGEVLSIYFTEFVMQ